MSTTPRPLLTQREAATACGVSRSTIRRRREAGELPGCVQDEERGWLIPVEALLAAGFRLNAPAPSEDAAPAGSTAPAAGPVAAGVMGEDVAALRAELERERQAHLEARHQAELAAAEAGHLRAQLAAKETHIEDLRTALRALAPAPKRAAIEPSAHPGTEAGVVVPGQVQPERAVPAGTEAGPEPGAEARRRWWGGRR
ncbi:helix-turn-helix transcriptional regulator [Streptomyces cinereoruber]|uniref:helix-turn-helix transcriptional regulator n=1 Tax=Streptomyces cinereoruber TaxID=67260 RepID=UPI003640A11B